MSDKSKKWESAVIGAGLLLLVSGCSKEKEQAATPATPAPETAPAVTMKEPEAPAPASEPPAKPATASAPTPSGGAITVRARFDGYAARVSKNTWQPVLLTTEAANFALLIPQDALPANSGLVAEGGPESLAVGTVAGMLKTTEGRPLVSGQEYRFTFRKSGDIWDVEITSSP